MAYVYGYRNELFGGLHISQLGAISSRKIVNKIGINDIPSSDHFVASYAARFRGNCQW